MRSDISAYVADYRGVLGWSAYTDGAGNARAAVEVELYIKDHPIPQRKIKFSEINTVQQIDPYSQMDTSVHTMFRAAPEILSVNITGFILTPFIGGVWQTKNTGGGLIFSGTISYPELIERYLQGEMDQTAGHAYQRRDPDYYITPYGQRYTYPQIASYDYSSTVNPKKAQFSMSLWLEI